ncbi:MAG: GNAT family N-acetyltransferase [Myxococcales bacterium]
MSQPGAEPVAVLGLDWAAWSLHEVIAAFWGAPFRWWVSGGLALELHSGHSWRLHGDTDVGILRSDVARAASWLPDLEFVVAAQGKLANWRGEPLVAGQNNVWLRAHGEHHWALDLTLSDGAERQWIYRRDPALTRPWSEAVLHTKEGVPYLAPELQLLFKSKTPRPRDTLDASMVIPLLDEAQHTFLERHLAPSHAWRQLLREHRGARVARAVPRLSIVMDGLPDGFSALHRCAEKEGFAHLSRLAAAWENGPSTPSPGEVLMEVRAQEQLVAIGALTAEPAESMKGALRVRRFYVHPHFRRRGLGRLLASALLDHGRAHSRAFTLHAPRPSSRAFWEAMGFVVDERDGFSHVRVEPDL